MSSKIVAVEDDLALAPCVQGSRVLLIGEAPGRGGGEPLGGRIGTRLAKLSGLALADYLTLFDRTNLLAASPPPARSKGSTFPLPEARAAVAALRRSWPDPGRVVLLGRRVGSAFGGVWTPLIWRAPPPGFPAPALWSMLPHPSGVNRWWNSLVHRAAAGLFMRQLAEECR